MKNIALERASELYKKVQEADALCVANARNNYKKWSKANSSREQAMARFSDAAERLLRLAILEYRAGLKHREP